MEDTPLLPLAEAESLEWLNKFFEKLWPKIDETAKKIVAEKVEPQIRDAVPSVAKGIHFKQFTLGNKPFILGPVKVYDLGAKGLMLRMGIDFKSDTDIEIALGFADVGLKNLTMTGELTLRFCQLMDEAPVVGGVVAYFLEPPIIRFEFTGLGSLLNVPGLAGIIEKTVDKTVAGMLVLPNQIAVCLGTEEQGVDLAKIKCPSPIALLKIQPKRARGLRGSDFHLFSKSTSDPYCIVGMADNNYTTSVVKNTRDPDWPEKDYGYFLLYDRSQQISLSVFDEDFANKDDSLGYSQPTQVAIALDDPKIMDPGIAIYSKACKPGRDPEGEVCGRVSLDIEFFQIEFGHGSLGDSEMCLLQVKLDKAVLPYAAGDQAKVIVTFKNGDYEICKPSPVGTAPPIKVVSKGIEKTLIGVIKRSAQKNMDSNEIAELVALPVKDVQAVVDGGNISRGFKPARMVDIEATLHFAVPRDKLDGSAQVELVVADKKDKHLASVTVGLDSVLQAEKLCFSPTNGRVICKGDMGDIPVDVVISLHATKSVKSKSGSGAPGAPPGWQAIREAYFGECSMEVEACYDDDWMRNEGGWALEQSTGGKNNDFMEHHFTGKALLLKNEKSVSAAINRLNTSEGHVACPEGYCVVYSDSKKLFFLVFRKEKLRKAHELFPDCFHK